MDVLNRADRQGLVAAVVNRAALLVVGSPSGINAVTAAAAVVLQPREHAPDVLDCGLLRVSRIGSIGFVRPLVADLVVGVGFPWGSVR